jgi:hypothetical protein
MDEPRLSDRLAVSEFLVYVITSFLSAWFLAGLSLSQLLEIISAISPGVRFVFAIASGAWLIRVIVRQINRRADPRCAKRVPIPSPRQRLQ